MFQSVFRSFNTSIRILLTLCCCISSRLQVSGVVGNRRTDERSPVKRPSIKMPRTKGHPLVEIFTASTNSGLLGGFSGYFLLNYSFSFSTCGKLNRFPVSCDHMLNIYASLGKVAIKWWAVSVCPSVCRVPRPNSRTERPWKPKISNFT